MTRKNAPLAWTITTSGGVRRFAVTGQIDEHGDYEGLAKALGDDNVFDLDGIARVNSIGTKEWSMLVRRAELENKKLAFERCSPLVVAQLNSVRAFHGHAVVRSVNAPFLCPACDTEAEVFVPVEPPHDAEIDALMAAGRKCPACGEAMELDDLIEHYFRFVRDR